MVPDSADASPIGLSILRSSSSLVRGLSAVYHGGKVWQAGDSRQVSLRLSSRSSFSDRITTYHQCLLLFRLRHRRLKHREE